MKRKKIYFIFFNILLTSLFIISITSISEAATPQLIQKLNSAFEEIEKWLLNLATPAAAVAVGSGVFMKKFSFGDEEKIKTGKKIIRGSLFSYGFILAIDLILSTIRTLIT